MEKLQDYLIGHTTAQDETLSWLERETHFRTVHPRMLSGVVMGRFLTSLVQQIKPSRILEIGTFTGYSSICMARALPFGGVVDTIEIFDQQEDLIREAFSRSGLQERINLHIGDALDVIPTLAARGLRYQLVYIDGNKREYPDYYNLVLPMVPSGGVILADNVLWDGKVTDAHCCDPQTEGIRNFNQKVQNDPSVTNVLLPLEDGVMWITKR